jgi:hypothetical protein
MEKKEEVVVTVKLADLVTLEMEKKEEVFEVVADLVTLTVKLLALAGADISPKPALNAISGMSSRIAELLNIDEEVCNTLMIKSMTSNVDTEQMKEFIETMQRENITTMGAS